MSCGIPSVAFCPFAVDLQVVWLCLLLSIRYLQTTRSYFCLLFCRMNKGSSVRPVLYIICFSPPTVSVVSTELASVYQCLSCTKAKAGHKAQKCQRGVDSLSSTCWLQSNKIIWVGMDLMRSSCPTPLLEQCQLEQVAQDLVESGVEYLQERTTLIVKKVPVSSSHTLQGVNHHLTTLSIHHL